MTSQVASRISVIIPAYNHENFVGRAVESVLAQSYDSYEIIAVDDGSTDQTAEILETYSPHGVVVLRQDNAGTAGALNLGLQVARGEFVSVLNSDDAYHPTRLARLIDHMRRSPRSVLCFTRARMVDGEDREIVSGPYYDWLQQAYAHYFGGGSLAGSLLHKNLSMTTSNYFFRASLIENMGGFVDLRYVNDLNFLFRAMEQGGVDFLDEILLDYRRHGSNTIDESWGERREDFELEMAWLLADLLRREKVLDQLDPAELIRIFHQEHGHRCRVVLAVLALMNRNPALDPAKLLKNPLLRTGPCNNVSDGQIEELDYRRAYQELVQSRSFRLIQALGGLAKGHDIAANLSKLAKAMRPGGSIHDR